MDTGVIAARRLHCWRELHHVDIARFHFDLHEKIKDAVELFGQDSQNADFGLVDDRLRPLVDWAKISFNPNPLDGEKLAARMNQVSRRVLE